jgi:hypothetical protein
MKKTISFKYIICSLIAVILTFLIHESTHWIMGELLGYEMIMTLNTAYPAKLSYDKDWQYTLISAVGPLITLLQALIIYLMIKKTSRIIIYPFLFSCFYLELVSGIMNYRNANDLGRISRSFNLGLFTLPLIFIAIHFIMIYTTSVREKYTSKFNLITFLWILLFSSFWILINKRFNVIILIVQH